MAYTPAETNIDDYGADPTGGADSTTAVQNAINASIQVAGDYALADAGNKVHLPLLKKTTASAGGIYILSDTVTISGVWNGIIDWNGAVFCWNGANDRPMFQYSDCRTVKMSNARLYCLPTKPCFTGISMKNATGGVTPTHNQFDNIQMWGQAAGFDFGWRVEQGSAGDANQEFNVWRSCEVYDYRDSAWTFEHSQSKHNSFFHCGFNSGYIGQCGVRLHHPQYFPNGNGSFLWVGGGGGTCLLSDFLISSPSDPITIIGVATEGSRRFFSTQLYDVVTGCVGTVPAPASLTMTTPAGTAYVITGSPQPVTVPQFVYTYTANKETYDIIEPAGTVTHYARNIGQAWDATPSGGTVCQKVTTNATQITAVLQWRGGRPNHETLGAQPITLEGCRYSSNLEASDGFFIVCRHRGPLNLIGNRFYTKTTYGKILVYGPGTGVAGTVVNDVGNMWLTDLAGPYPSLQSRTVMDEYGGIPGNNEATVTPTLGNYQISALGENIMLPSNVKSARRMFEIWG